MTIRESSISLDYTLKDIFFLAVRSPQLEVITTAAPHFYQFQSLRIHCFGNPPQISKMRGKMSVWNENE